jgi:hypothetical protein
VLFNTRTSDIYLYGFDAVNGKFLKRSPDASLAHAGAQYLSILIEISYSQDEEGGEEALILETTSDQEADVRPPGHFFLNKRIGR